jgi:hypothetical protein
MLETANAKQLFRHYINIKEKDEPREHLTKKNLTFAVLVQIT